MKKVLVQFTFPNLPQKKYEQAWEKIREKGLTNIPGLLYHVGAQKGKDWLVVDVWESEAQFKKFGDTTLAPLFAEIGIPKVQPLILPVHYLHVGEAAAALVH